MKTGILAMFAGVVTLAAIQIAEAAPLPSDTGAKQEAATPHRKKRARLSPEQQMARFGGFVEAAYSGRRVYFIDAQRRVPAAVAEWIARQVGIALSLPTRVVRPESAGGDNVPTAIRLAREAGGDVGAAVAVVDVPDMPTLLVAPEDGWAQVNLAALARDTPAAEVLEARLKKELWRAFILVFGGGNSQFEGDVMRPICSPRDLDAHDALVSSPEPFNTVMSGAKARGVTPIRRTTYLSACREGWAPPPTNEFQKVIWEKVNAEKERGPTNPLTIPPPKKDAK